TPSQFLNFDQGYADALTIPSTPTPPTPVNSPISYNSPATETESDSTPDYHTISLEKTQSLGVQREPKKRRKPSKLTKELARLMMLVRKLRDIQTSVSSLEKEFFEMIDAVAAEGELE